MKIAISTGGGDAPGLNAVIRAAVLTAHDRGWETVGIRRGFHGLLDGSGVVPLGAAEVSGITHLGGTILGSTNRGNPLRWPKLQPDGRVLKNSEWDSGSFNTPDGKKIYSYKLSFNYAKGEQKQLLFSLKADKYQKGNYTMQVYYNGIMIGRVSKTLS